MNFDPSLPFDAVILGRSLFSVVGFVRSAIVSIVAGSSELLIDSWVG